MACAAKAAPVGRVSMSISVVIMVVTFLITVYSVSLCSRVIRVFCLASFCARSSGILRHRPFPAGRPEPGEQGGETPRQWRPDGPPRSERAPAVLPRPFSEPVALYFPQQPRVALAHQGHIQTREHFRLLRFGELV